MDNIFVCITCFILGLGITAMAHNLENLCWRLSNKLMPKKWWSRNSRYYWLYRLLFHWSNKDNKS